MLREQWTPTRHRQPSRRQFLLAGSGLLGATLTGCDAFSTSPAGQGESTRESKGDEAPSLAKLVDSGDLPPVSERLPQNPLVVDVVDEIGTYGGVWNSGILGPSDVPWLDRTLGYQNLVNWNPDFTDVTPNIAESYEVSSDATEITFRLREGMKWSDGEPFTADDIMFWYQDVIGNKELTPSVPGWLFRGGEPGIVEKLDDFAIRFQFAEPYGIFLQVVATDQTRYVCGYPRHYAEQFHKSYNTDADQLAQDEGFDDWVALFGARTDTWAYGNKDLPTLFGWRLTQEVGAGSRVTLQRNPYFWKVDPDGSQLPYLDGVSYVVDQEVEGLLLRAVNGEIDMMSRHFNTRPNKPVLARESESSEYGFFTLRPMQMNTTLVLFNLAHDNPTRREIFQNKEFRIALSHAINRQAIIDTVYHQQGEPWQAAPRPESDHYNDQLAKQYTDYDVDEANTRLDAAGYDERDADGFRLGPDGERISFTLEINNFRPEWSDVGPLLRKYWREVGIDAQTKTEDRSLWMERVSANKHDVVIWEGPGGNGPDLLLTPSYYFPFDFWSFWARPWAEWYESGGEGGAEPPPPAVEQMRLYDQLKASPDEDERAEILDQILDISAEQFYVLGISLEVDSYGIVKNDFKNVPESMPWGFRFLNPAPTVSEQYFLDR